MSISIVPYIGEFPNDKCDYFSDNRLRRSFALFSEDNDLKDVAFKFTQIRNGYFANPEGPIANACFSCRSCVPLRVNIGEFEMGRTHRKQQKKTPFNFLIADPKTYDLETLFPIYQKYFQQRHADSEMKHWDSYYLGQWLETNPILLVAYSCDDEVVAFSTIDGHQNELSLEYSVYDPNYLRHGLGSQLWIQTMLLALRTNMDFVYVGPWAEGSEKLNYKRNFKGLEAFQNGTWVRFDPQTHIQGPDNARRLAIMGHPNL